MTADWASCPCKTCSTRSISLVDLIRVKLQAWADDMWVRYGGDGVGVFLVGSVAAGEPHPRDCDISIVLPPALFATRYGTIEGDWEQWTPPPYKPGERVMHPDQVKMMREVGKQVKRLSHCLDSILPPDLKVMSAYESMKHLGPKIRLDSFARFDDHAYKHYGSRPEWANPK